jgi:uncharacterized protein (TIGR03437 family)
MIHATHSRLNSVLIGLMVAMCPGAMRAEGPSQRLQVAPDTVYLDKVGNETVLSRTVKVMRTGPPGAALTFTASVTTSSGAAWLAVNPASGTVPSDLTITGTPGTLAAGTYYGNVTVTPSGQGMSPEVVNVVLRIHTPPGGGPTAPAVSIRPGALNFEMVQGGANPDNRTLDIASPTGGKSFNWTAAKTITTPPGGAWLQIAPTSGSGPGSVAVSVNGTGLAAGQYNGSITVTSGSSTAQVSVSLEVKPATNPQLVIDPNAFNFIILPDGPVPAPKTLRVKNAGSGTLNWTAAATSGGWLSISPTSGSAPANIALTVHPSGLAAGMYEGAVKVTAAGLTKTARVFLRIVGKPANPGAPSTPNQAAVQISPQAVEFSAPVGGPVSPASIPVQIASKITGLTFAASGATARGGNWLNVLPAPASGSIPGTITVTANAAGLAAGLYTGVINIKVQGSVSEQRIVAVTLRVGTPGETPSFTLQPGTVVFQAVSGGPSPAPAPVTLGASGATSLPFSATISTSFGNWLLSNTLSGTTPATITVSAANFASLSPGTYSGAIVFQATGSTGALPATLNVMLVVGPASSPVAHAVAAASQGALFGAFLTPAAEFVAARNAPQAVQVMLFASDGTPVEGADVVVSPSSGEPGFALEDAGGGLYTGLFHSLAGGPLVLTAAASTSQLSVSFSAGGDVDGGASPQPAIFHGGIVNAANFSPAPTPIVPGSILTLFGTELTDSTMFASGFPLPRDLGGVKVLVAGIEAPLIAVVADSGQGFDQIVFQAPMELRAVTFADVMVLKDGMFSPPEGIGIAPVLPALFTGNGQGTGMAAALHADYSLVTSDSPARPGELILLFSTGLGDVQPSPGSGEAAGNNSRVVSADVQVTLAGRLARADFVGLAPGYSGLYQMNVIVPADSTPGDAALLITVGGIGSGEDVVVPIGSGK